MANRKTLCLIVEELQTIYHCHTIILYGSMARGDFKSTSDYDVAGFTSIDNKKWIARFDQTHQVFHEAFKTIKTGRIMTVTLIPATLEEYPTIQNMARFYVYEMSRECGLNSPDWACPADGLYESFDFKHYFTDKKRRAYLDLLLRLSHIT